jgi:hypothetical protein
MKCQLVFEIICMLEDKFQLNKTLGENQQREPPNKFGKREPLAVQGANKWYSSRLHPRPKVAIQRAPPTGDGTKRHCTQVAGLNKTA